MSDLKTERLINLTMALLASRRLITKSEIFRSVAGYSGATESMERMFERDKDDLRSLGIEIEVAPIDSLFEDESGYRIFPDKYALKIPDLTPAELGVLSVAATSWQTSFFSESGQQGLRKLKSLGVEIQEDVLITSIIPVDQNQPHFETLWEAISQSRSISFHYADNKKDLRTIDPYGISCFKGEWYIVGFDRVKAEIRTFKVRRISNLKLVGKKDGFKRPKDFRLREAMFIGASEAHYVVKMKIRTGQALSLRSGSTLLEIEDDWDVFERSYAFEGAAIFDALWYGEDVVVLEPQSLRDRVLQILRGRVA